MNSTTSFDLVRLLRTVFVPIEGLRVAILIDLENPADMKDLAFLEQDLEVQKHAYEKFFLGLRNGGMDELGLTGGDIFAYKITGGSNLDLPDTAVTPAGETVSLEADVYPNYSLILCISTYSATAPLTAFARKYGFRGATLHGLNDVILNSGLSVDYRNVSAAAEKLRLGMTEADNVEIDFQFNGEIHTLHLELSGQEAQKSHGLCHGTHPDVANLPAGEVYFVPTSAQGAFPMKYEDGSIAIQHVNDGRITKVTFMHGSEATIQEHRETLVSDPITGEIGELGFGTQDLPFSGADIQDEKVLGSIHVATGRSDHLGGHLTPDLFGESEHASHDDILFHPDKTPEILVSQVRMQRKGEDVVLIENYKPASYLLGLLATEAEGSKEELVTA